MGQSQRTPYLKPYMWVVSLAGAIIAAWRRVPHLRKYMWGMSLIGAAIIAASARNAWHSLSAPDLGGLALFSGLVAVSCFLNIKVPETNLEMTMTMPLAFSLFLVHRLWICIVFASIPYLVTFICTKFRELTPERLIRAACFNTAGFTIAICVASGVYLLAGGGYLGSGYSFVGVEGIGLVLKLALWIGVYNFVNIGICSICYSLYDPKPLKVILFESLRGWSIPNLLFGVPVSVLFVSLYQMYGPWGAGMLIVPLLAGRQALNVHAQELEAYYDTITTLGAYVQHYHPYTKGHLERVADLADRVARQMGLPLQSLSLIRDAGRLHDIGKVGVGEEVLDKIGKLSDEDWSIIRQHPARGAEILSGLKYLEKIVPWVRGHHERPDGKGYPDGLTLDDIPVEAAVIAVADAFDAMTGGPDEKDRRNYRPPLTLDQAMDQLRYGAGTQFDTRVVRAFIRVMAREEAEDG